MADALQDQVEKNYEAFTKQLPSLLATHRGKFALMRNGKIAQFFDTARDAHVAGQALFADGLFSIQEVSDGSVDLGYYSYAVPDRTV